MFSTDSGSISFVSDANRFAVSTSPTSIAVLNAFTDFGSNINHTLLKFIDRKFIFLLGTDKENM